MADISDLFKNTALSGIFILEDGIASTEKTISDSDLITFLEVTSNLEMIDGKELSKNLIKVDESIIDIESNKALDSSLSISSIADNGLVDRGENPNMF